VTGKDKLPYLDDFRKLQHDNCLFVKVSAMDSFLSNAWQSIQDLTLYEWAVIVLLFSICGWGSKIFHCLKARDTQVKYDNEKVSKMLENTATNIYEIRQAVDEIKFHAENINARAAEQERQSERN
jgi:hypothetical protein